MKNFWLNLPRPFSVLAPMEDVTDVVFRKIILETARPDVFFTEFTSINGLISKGYDKVARRLTFNKEEQPIVAQIWGNDPELFYKAAVIIKDLGFNGIDINMGCPDRKVMKLKCGAAMIGNEENVKEIIKAVRTAAPELPLSIKTRVASTEDKTSKWLKFLLSQDLQAITLHARTAKDLSKVPARWEEIKKLVEYKNQINPNIVIIGNGDLIDHQDIISKHNTYGADGGMIGRGIFHNAWAFERTQQTHTSKENLEVLLKHTKLFTQTWGTSKNFQILKKFFKVYVKGYPGADELRQKLMETNSYEEVEKIVTPNL